MNKKGLTLVELLAVIVILAAIALIITPNILRSISNYKEGMYDTQLDNIKAGAKNWAADIIDQRGCLICVPEDNTQIYDCEQGGCIEAAKDSGLSTTVTLSVLEDNGYVDEDLKNPKTSKKFNRCLEVVITINPSTGNYIYSIPDPETNVSCSL